MEHNYNFNSIHEIKSAADKLIAHGAALNLHVVIELGFRYDEISIVAYTVDENGELADRAYTSRPKGVSDPEIIGEAFSGLGKFLNEYHASEEARLTAQVDKLSAELTEATKALERIQSAKEDKPADKEEE